MDPNTDTRRTFLKALGGASLVGSTALAGCSASGDVITNRSNSLMGVAMKSLSSFFFRAESQAAEYEAKQLGYESSVIGARGNSETLNRKIAALSARNDTAAILTDPVNSTAQQSPISNAMDTGIPVSVIDTPPAEEATITVAFDNYIAGKNLAKRCVKELKRKYDSLDGEKVVNFHGFLGSYAWKQRMQGTRDYMQKVARNTGLEFYNVPGGASPQEFATTALEWFSQNDNVAAALNASSGDFMAGIIRALDQEGMLYYRGEDEHVLIGAVDGYLSDVQWLNSGLIDFISAQDGVAYGQIAVDLLDKYAVGNGTRDVMPVGEVPDINTNRFYFGQVLNEEPKIQMTDFGPLYRVPTYMMDPVNVKYRMTWPKVAHRRLGLESQAAELNVSPKGTPPKN